MRINITNSELTNPNFSLETGDLIVRPNKTDVIAVVRTDNNEYKLIAFSDKLNRYRNQGFPNLIQLTNYVKENFSQSTIYRDSTLNIELGERIY